eukprot:scaffold1446_cov145-Skeletonema_menzelii.AAC.22
MFTDSIVSTERAWLALREAGVGEGCAGASALLVCDARPCCIGIFFVLHRILLDLSQQMGARNGV